MARRRKADPNIAVAYLRVSTDRQALGLDAQRSALSTWATNHSVTIAGWHVDEGLSGSLDVGDRPGLAAAMQHVSELRAGRLVVARRDRLARDLGVVAMVEHQLKASGAVVSACDDMADAWAADAQAVMHARLRDMFAELERSRIRDRTIAALRVKKARGEKLGGHAPYGWRGEHGMLVPDQSEQAVIRLVRELRACGVTLAGIAEALEARGLRTRIGGRHNVRSVSTVLAADAY